MRPLAVLVALCLTPAADACFFKCFRKGGASQPAAGAFQAKSPVKEPGVRIYKIYGKSCDDNPEVPANLPGIPVEVHCSFDPTGYKPSHMLNDDKGEAPAVLTSLDVRTFYEFDLGSGEWIQYWEFTYKSLPSLAMHTGYTLRIKVKEVTSDPTCKFHTP